jgi:cell division protein FtsB
MRPMSTTAARPRAAAKRGRSGGARARGTRRGGIRWDRLSRIALVAVLAAVLLSYLGPATKYVRTWRLSHATHTEAQNLRTENTELRARAKRLKNPQQIELEARRLGMARPGERAFVIRGLPRD